MATPDIRSRVDAFVADLQELIRTAALGAVMMSLEAGVPGSTGRRRMRAASRATRRAASAVRTAARKAGKRIRRSTEDVEALAAKVLAHVKANAGHRLEDIGRGLRMDTKHLKRPIQKLRAERRLKTEGQKRGTKYFAGSGGGSAAPKAAKTAKRGRRGKRRAQKPTAVVEITPAVRRAKKPKPTPIPSGGHSEKLAKATMAERMAKLRAAKSAKQETGVS